MAVITISRQYGSGGEEVANRVAKMLQYRLFDKILMTLVATEVGLSEDELVDFSETNYTVQGFLERLFKRRTVAQVSSWGLDDTGARVKLVEEQDEMRRIDMARVTIQAAYKKGNIIIVGRGGQAIIKDKPGVLHIRIEAPMNRRVQHIRDTEHISLKEAQKVISERDTASAAYLKRFHDINWSDPMLYHLVINTGKWDIKTAAQVISNVVNYLPQVDPSGET